MAGRLTWALASAAILSFGCEGAEERAADAGATGGSVGGSTGGAAGGTGGDGGGLVGGSSGGASGGAGGASGGASGGTGGAGGAAGGEGGAGGAAGGSAGGAGGSAGGSAGGAGGSAGGEGGAGGSAGGAGGSAGGEGGAGGAAGGSGGAGGSPDLPCHEIADEGACEADPACGWYAPGCMEPALPAAGCFVAEPCLGNADCPEGTTCEPVAIDPCRNEPCDACGQLLNLCVPAAADPCAGAALGPEGNCLDAAGAPTDPICCAPYDCDESQVACNRIPPACPPGQAASVVGLCWGPCVDALLCAPSDDELLCASTGGGWSEEACGSPTCGVPNECAAIIPGCDCGPFQTFLPGVGCQNDPQCPGAEGSACEVANPLCAPGLSCLERFGEGMGVCSDPGCRSDDECGAGEVCCYPCGIPGCANACMAPAPEGGCPLFP